MMQSPDAAILAREALYICSPKGFVAYKCNTVPTTEDLVNMGFLRVEFKPVQLRPPVCPVNGAEGGDTPYWVRLPHRPDGTRLRYY
jgi:hypothetical protein